MSSGAGSWPGCEWCLLRGATPSTAWTPRPPPPPPLPLIPAPSPPLPPHLWPTDTLLTPPMAALLRIWLEDFPTTSPHRYTWHNTYFHKILEVLLKQNTQMLLTICLCWLWGFDASVMCSDTLYCLIHKPNPITIIKHLFRILPWPWAFFQSGAHVGGLHWQPSLHNILSYLWTQYR